MITGVGRHSAQGARTVNKGGCKTVQRPQESFPEESIFDLILKRILY